MEQGLIVPQVLRRDSGYSCEDSDCEDTIYYGEEAVLIQVATLRRGDGELLKDPVLDLNDPDHDFLFEPHYFCMECWNALYDFVRNELSDKPPIHDPFSTLTCSCCSSGIREGMEYVGVAEVGEFRRSRRAPDGLSGPYYEVTANPLLLCLSCLLVINEGLIELWSNLTQDGECIDCSDARCWRAPCTCTCHNSLPESTE